MRTKVIVKNIIFVLVIASILVTPTYKAVTAATKLNADDFEAKINSESKTWSFFVDLAFTDEEEGVRGFAYDETYDASKKGVITTSRGINIGSQSSILTEKYGKGIKHTLSEDVVYNSMPKDSLSYFSNAEYVLTYEYSEKAEAGGEYTLSIHFYIDKNEEIVLIFYSRVLKNTHEAADEDTVNEADAEIAEDNQNTDTEAPETGEKNSMASIYLVLAAATLMGSYKLKKVNRK